MAESLKQRARSAMEHVSSGFAPAVNKMRLLSSLSRYDIYPH